METCILRSMFVFYLSVTCNSNGKHDCTTNCIFVWYIVILNRYMKAYQEQTFV